MLKKNDTGAITGISYIKLDGPEKDLSTYTKAGNYVTIALAAEKEWISVEHTQLQAAFSENQKDTPAGEQYTPTLQLILGGDDAEQLDELTGLSGMPLAVKMDYENGVSKIIGSPDYPVFMGSDLGSANFETKRTLTFAGNMPHPSLFLL